jgi:hypothetical protein
MNQTVKFGKMRASSDPDRSNVAHGLYFGANVVRRSGTASWQVTRTTRGAWVKREVF